MISIASSKDAVPIVNNTPFDTSSAVWTGSGGNIHATMQSGKQVLFTNVPAGVWLPVQITLVSSDTTTATGLVAGYY